MQIIEGRRKRKYEIRACERILGVAPIDGVSGEGWEVAKILQILSTIPALPIDSANPGDTHPGPNRQLLRSPSDDLAHYLMTRDEGFAARR